MDITRAATITIAALGDAMVMNDVAIVMMLMMEGAGYDCQAFSTHPEIKAQGSSTKCSIYIIKASSPPPQCTKEQLYRTGSQLTRYHN